MMHLTGETNGWKQLKRQDLDGESRPAEAWISTGSDNPREQWVRLLQQLLSHSIFHFYLFIFYQPHSISTSTLSCSSKSDIRATYPASGEMKREASDKRETRLMLMKWKKEEHNRTNMISVTWETTYKLFDPRHLPPAGCVHALQSAPGFWQPFPIRLLSRIDFSNF